MDSPRFEPHPQRDALLLEAHARPFHAVSTPSRFCHFAFATTHAQALSDRSALTAFCRDLGLPEPVEDSKHHWMAWDSLALRWEQHSEFTTYTWELHDAEADLAPDARAHWMRKLPEPGPLLVCVDLALTREPEIDAERRFETPSLAMAYLDDRTALAATDFVADKDGFVRFVVADLGLTPIRAGALVQRLLELETYRMFALLGLPEAQRLAPEVGVIERQLADIAVAMTRSAKPSDSHELLLRLTSLAARLEAGAAASLFRFGASRAYADIVQGRLEAIGEESCRGYPTFSAFMSRRLAPAMRTCLTVESRQADLSRKLARAAQLLRTQVDLEIERQNQELLASMNARTHLQLRLQRAVETLSIAAASYYVVGLVGHVAVTLPKLGVRGLDPDMVTAASIPVVVCLVIGAFVLRQRSGAAD